LKDKNIVILEKRMMDKFLPNDLRIKAMHDLDKYVIEKREEAKEFAKSSGRLTLYNELRVPIEKINIELSEHAVGEHGPFPFFLMKMNHREVVSITLHKYPVAQKVVRNHFSCTSSDEYVVDDALINRWLDVEGFHWFHIDDFDVTPTPANPFSEDE